MRKNINKISSKKIVYTGGVLSLLLPFSAYAWLRNPISYPSLIDFLRALLEVITQIGVIALTVMLIYSGFLFVTAQGNQEQLTKAKSAFSWVVIGGAIVLGAWALSIGIAETVNQLRPGSS